jgi:hypothetical protein
VRVLFSYRDVRDIATSTRKKWGWDFDRILSEINTMIEIESLVLQLPNAVVQPYEVLFAQLPNAICRVAKFLDIALASDEVERIGETLSVDAVRSRLKRRSKGSMAHILSRLSVRFRIDPTTLLHDDHLFASAGRAWDWINQFTSAEIDTLNQRYASWLAAHGYRPPST